MKKYILGLFFSLYALHSAYASNLDKVRSQFPYFSSFNEVEVLLQSIEEETSDLGTVYKGALNMFKSKFADSKWDQYKYFKLGKTQIEQACKSNPNSLEIRYIRMIFQYQLPAFLGYNDDKKADFDFFIKNFSKSSLPTDFKRKMLKNLLLLDPLTATQKQQLNNLI